MPGPKARVLPGLSAPSGMLRRSARGPRRSYSGDRRTFGALRRHLLDRMAVPELLQGAATPQRIADTALGFLLDPERAAAVVAAQREGLAAMAAGDEPPSRQAARAVLEVATERAKRAAVA